MARDTRWSAAIFLIARSVQLTTAMIVMGIACYFATPIFVSVWYIGYVIAVALLTIIYIAVNFGLFFSNLLLPLAIIIIEPILFVTWALGAAAIGIGNSDVISGSCVAWDGYSYGISETCVLLKAGFALTVMEVLLLISTLVMASVAMHKTRGDPRGRLHGKRRKANRSVAMAAVVAPQIYMQNPQQHPPYHAGSQQQYSAHGAGSQQMYPPQQQYTQQPQYQPVNPQMYQQSTPGMQPPAYPQQPTGSPRPYR